MIASFDPAPGFSVVPIRLKASCSPCLVSRPLARHGSYSGFVAGALGKLEDFLQAAVRRPIEVISKRGSAATALPRRAASSDFLAGRRGSSAKAGVGAAGGGKIFPDYALSSADLALYKKGTLSVFQGVRHGAQQGSVSEGAERAAVS